MYQEEFYTKLIIYIISSGSMFHFNYNPRKKILELIKKRLFDARTEQNF